MFTLAILTVSDKGSQGQRVDESGQVIRDIFTGLGHRVVHYDIVP
ncbi:MAG: molybdopterin-binding protein, partial [Chloroflexota bacterium]|nr:molybdopterin-binding protein [Chloroflexota bacterium]